MVANWSGMLVPKVKWIQNLLEGSKDLRLPAAQAEKVLRSIFYAVAMNLGDEVQMGNGSCMINFCKKQSHT